MRISDWSSDVCSSDLGPVTNATAAPAWARTLRRFNDWWLTDIGGGPRVLTVAWVINTQKAGTFLFLGALMFFYAIRTRPATSLAAWHYRAMHGRSVLVWLTTGLALPAPVWPKGVTSGGRKSVVEGMDG